MADQFVISLNALLCGRKMIVANDTGQFLTADGWNYLGTPFAIEANSLDDLKQQLNAIVEQFWKQIYQETSEDA